jgi:hypothetical protein
MKWVVEAGVGVQMSLPGLVTEGKANTKTK